MVDYLAKYPTIETKTCEREKIVSGYIANRMVDPTIQRIPYFCQISSTCKRQISTKKMGALSAIQMFNCRRSDFQWNSKRGGDKTPTEEKG